MDLKEIKKITAYAKKAGIKSLKFGDVEIVFGDHLPSKPRLVPEEVSSKPQVQQPPTLDEINAYIYSVDEVG